MREIAAASLLLAATWCGGCGRADTAGDSNMHELALRIDAPSEAQASRPVKVRLTLKNTASSPVQVTLGGRPPVDVVLATPDGRDVARWLTHETIQAILELKTLGAGEETGFDVEWLVKTGDGGTPAPGRYLVRGVLNMDPPETLESAPREILLSN